MKINASQLRGKYDSQLMGAKVGRQGISNSDCIRRMLGWICTTCADRLSDHLLIQSLFVEAAFVHFAQIV